MASTPIINFIDISGRDVSAEYKNLPAGSKVVFVNETSGETLDDPVEAVADSGTLKITLPKSFPSGAFYLKAQDSAGGNLAQSVQFYVA